MSPVVAPRVSTPVLPEPFLGVEIADVKPLFRLAAAKELVEMRDAMRRVDPSDLDGFVGIVVEILNRDCELFDIVNVGSAAHRQ